MGREGGALVIDIAVQDMDTWFKYIRQGNERLVKVLMERVLF